MDPVRNPYAPGAGQRPPELAGRDRELGAFQVVLERVARGRPERSLVLTGLRGVGKTVLLNALRSEAINRLWGTGKIEARPEQSLRRPLASALHMAVRELAPRHRAPERVDEFLGVLKAFALRASVEEAGPAARGGPGAGGSGARGGSGAGGSGAGRRKGSGRTVRDRWQPGIDVPAATGRADSGDIEIDLVELFTDAAEVAADVGTGVALFLDEMQDLGPDEVSALCAACHELSQSGAPLIVVGAGLPHLPAVLSAAKSYSERMFSYQRIDKLDRIAADHALAAPAAREEVEYEPKALDVLFDTSGGYPYFVQAYGKATWDHAPRSPITAADVRVARPAAEAELAVGFFGARYERATPAEREYLRTMADLSPADGVNEDGEPPDGDPPNSASRDSASRDSASRDSASRDSAPADGADQGSAYQGRAYQGRAAPDGLPPEREFADETVATAEIARALNRKPASLSPARDSLIKKGLIYSGERGTVAFTVPHFGRYLRGQATDTVL